MPPGHGDELTDPADVSTTLFDVFVGGTATVDLVQRTIEHTLYTDTFRGTGWARLGRHALLHVGVHDLPDDLLRDRALPVLLASDYPIRIMVRAAQPEPDRFQHEATARRVFTVIRANAWPVVLTHLVSEVLDLTRHR